MNKNTFGLAVVVVICGILTSGCAALQLSPPEAFKRSKPVAVSPRVIQDGCKPNREINNVVIISSETPVYVILCGADGMPLTYGGRPVEIKKNSPLVYLCWNRFASTRKFFTLTVYEKDSHGDLCQVGEPSDLEEGWGRKDGLLFCYEGQVSIIFNLRKEEGGYKPDYLGRFGNGVYDQNIVLGYYRNKGGWLVSDDKNPNPVTGVETQLEYNLGYGAR